MKIKLSVEGSALSAMRIWALLVMSACSAVRADDFVALCADRAAIERVYYNHRLGEKPPFGHVYPPSLIEQLVKEALLKEALLRKVYGVQLPAPLIEAEVRRINATTRAPEMLAEINAALGHDPAKFANVFAKPILVERLLRDKFENDDTLHATARRHGELVRDGLLSARTNSASVSQLLAHLKHADSNLVTETTWQLTPRPAETNPPAADEIEIRKRFGPNAQILSSPRASASEPKFYYEDLPPGLQNVLRAQLRQPRDVSAVIETPGGFLLYVATEKSKTTLSVACLALPKRRYEQWLAEQKP